jgi:hypothetical protein
MRKISFELLTYLMNNTNKPDMPPLKLNEPHPFTPRSYKAVGVIDPYMALGIDFDYVVESSKSLINDISPNLDTASFWLYKRDELKAPSNPVLVPQYYLDPNVKEQDQMFDITDCCIELPSEIDKLTCPLVSSLDQLLKLEPNLADCLKSNRGKFNGKQKRDK